MGEQVGETASFPGSAETFSIIYGRRLGRVITEVSGAD
jgi:hypothetical protein